uniref:Uncharacterized protein n=1 Tax=Anopheles coluzzii TaxID=1518534 RepID=A0A8W7PUC0_ANOCL
MLSAHIIVYGAVAGLFLFGQLDAAQNNGTSTTTGSSQRNRVLSRKRRFLLFPPGANFIVTISGGKGSMFETPRGYNLVAELDMYHPLPDYMYHATSLRLGEIARYPNEVQPTTAAKPAATAPTIPHGEHVLSQQELDEYLVQHPEAWIPANWANDRTDGAGSKYTSGMKYLTAGRPHSSPPITYQSWKRKLWESTGNDRLYYSNLPPKRARSMADAVRGAATEPSLWMEANHLNISHHRGWEHFHHYRDRRSLFDHLETTVPSFYPLKADLTDEYSEMLRTEQPNCRQLFSERCPLSILQLLLFGKFEL